MPFFSNYEAGANIGTAFMIQNQNKYQAIENANFTNSQEVPGS